MTEEKRQSILVRVKREVCNSRLFVQTLFDPIQTHAVYGLDGKQELTNVKTKLKRMGANKFRTIKTYHGYFILCFNGEKVKY